MSLEFYKVLHIVGLVLVMLGFGVLLYAPKEAPRPRSAMVLHGVGVLVLIVAGFGTMARMGIMAPDSWPAWVILKMIVWAVVAALPTLIRAGTVPRKIAWLVVPALAALAAWLAIHKPAFS